MINKFLHSIQWRIFVYYTVLISVALWLLLLGFYFYERQVMVRTAELELQTKMVNIIPFYWKPNGSRSGAGFGSPGQGGPPVRFAPVQGPEGMRPMKRDGAASRPPPIPPENFNGDDMRKMVKERHETLLTEMREQHLFFYVEDADGKVLEQSENFPAELLPIKQLVQGRKNWEFVNTDTQLYTMQLLPGRGSLIMGMSHAAWITGLNTLMWKASLICLAVMGVICIVGFWMIRSSLRPIKEISDTAKRIATGDVNERIDTVGVRSELGSLAEVLNTTFGRLGAALTRQIQFTSDASHELRTPVAAILADCQFSLKRERSPERYRETIEVCHESAQHMRSLIQDLRDLAHFDEKDTPDVSELVDMKEFLANVLSVMNPLAAEKGIELGSELESAMVLLDPMRMRQAVLNLLGNALRYTEEGGQVIVRCVRKVNDVVIEVHDTGIGISSEKLAHIFDRFYRADEARAAHTGGVGLGLSISKAIVEANGGEISVESEVGKGTCFRIQLAGTPVG